MKRIKNRLRIFSLIAFIFIPYTISFAETVNYTYDDLNRLIQSQYSDGTVVIYDYDKLGNRTLKRKLYKPHILTIQKTGAGTGTVTSSPVRINCGSTCSETFSEGTSITLTATADPGFVFIEFSGAGCSGPGPCVVTMTADTTVEAVFQSCSNPPVKMGGNYYYTLQAAYDAAVDGALIQVQNVTLIGDLTAVLAAV